MKPNLDINRLIIVIKERETLVARLNKLLEKAKQENKGDVFKINRVLMSHTESLKQLKDSLAKKIGEEKRKAQDSYKNSVKEEEAAVNRLRIQIANWSLDGL